MISKQEYINHLIEKKNQFYSVQNMEAAEMVNQEILQLINS